ncbi:MAG: hypothetical protein ACXW1D_08610, partial [Halobacteriota archaeon]
AIFFMIHLLYFAQVGLSLLICATTNIGAKRIKMHYVCFFDAFLVISPNKEATTRERTIIAAIGLNCRITVQNERREKEFQRDV